MYITQLYMEMISTSMVLPGDIINKLVEIFNLDCDRIEEFCLSKSYSIIHYSSTDGLDEWLEEVSNHLFKQPEAAQIA